MPQPSRLTSFALIAATSLAPFVASAQTAASAGAAGRGITGSIAGTVTAASAAGLTIKVANTLVELWTTDAATEATRDSACATWLADKSIWMQAKGEAESPSGVNWTGTAVGNDLRMLASLYALRRDTVRTNADGEFTFANVPFGAYTIDAESFANDKFLQWTADAPVIPPRKTRLNLDSSTLTENQYCAVTQAPADSSKVYDAGALDHRLEQVSTNEPASSGLRPATSHPVSGEAFIQFIVDKTGTPELQSVTVTAGGLSRDDARAAVENMRFKPPTVNGVPVRAKTSIQIGQTVTVTKVQRP